MNTFLSEDEAWVQFVWSFTRQLRGGAPGFRLRLLTVAGRTDGLEVVWAVGAVFEDGGNVVNFLGYLCAAWQGQLAAMVITA